MKYEKTPDEQVISRTPFPASKKIFVPGQLHVIQVAMREINQLTADRVLLPLDVKVFAFEEFVEAHRYMDDCPCRGRVALELA